MWAENFCQVLVVVSTCIAAICVVAMGIIYVLPVKSEWKQFSFRCAAWASIITIITFILFAIICRCELLHPVNY